MIGCGRGSFELTGYEEEEVRRPADLPGARPELRERRGPHRDGARVGRARARQAGHAAHRGRPVRRRATADLFPAYDDDGGLLLVLTPVALSCRSMSPMSDRARNAFVLAVVIALVLVSLLVTVGIPGVVKAKKTRLGLDLQGGVELIFQARPGPTRRSTRRRSANAIDIIRHARRPARHRATPSITQSGSDEIDVEPAERRRTRRRPQSVVGVTGAALLLRLGEERHRLQTGKVAGPNDPGVNGDAAQRGAAASGYVTEYQAVTAGCQAEADLPEARAAGWRARLTAATTTSTGQDQDRGRRPGNGAAQGAGDPVPAGRISRRRNRSCRRGARLVYVQPGTVVVQATSSPEVAGSPTTSTCCATTPFLTGKEISNPQATTDPTQGIVVSFGFKGAGASIFQNVTAVLAKRGQNELDPGAQQQLPALRASRSTAQLVTVPSIDFTQYPQRHPVGQRRRRSPATSRIATGDAARERAGERRAADQARARSPPSRSPRRSATRRSTRA